MKKLGAAVIGLKMGEEHFAAYSIHPEVDVVAICDSDRELLEKVAKAYKIKTTGRVVSGLLVLTSIFVLSSNRCAWSRPAEVNPPALRNADFTEGTKSWGISYNKEFYAECPVEIMAMEMTLDGRQVTNQVLRIQALNPHSSIELRQQLPLPSGRYELTCEFRTDNDQEAGNIVLFPMTSMDDEYQVAIVNNSKSSDGWIKKTVRFSSPKDGTPIVMGLTTCIQREKPFAGKVWIRQFALRAIPSEPLPVDGIWFWDGALIPYTNYPANAGDYIKGRWPSFVTRKRFDALFDSNAPVIEYAKRFNALMIRAALLQDDIKRYQRILAYLGKEPDTQLANEPELIFSLLDECNRSFGQIYQAKLLAESKGAEKPGPELGDQLKGKLEPDFEIISKKIEACQAAAQARIKEYARNKPEQPGLNSEFKIAPDGTPSRMFFVAWTDKLRFREMMPDLGIWRIATGSTWGMRMKDTGAETLDWSVAIEKQRELEAQHFVCAGFSPDIYSSGDYGPLPKNFKNKHLKDPDIWRGQPGQTYNMYNPEVQHAIQQVASDMGSQLKGAKWLFYVYLEEHAGPQQVDLTDNKPGRPSALNSFHKFLEKTYGSVEKLNQAWRASYKSLSDVRFPKYSEISGTKVAIGNPIIHDRELWRQQEYAGLARSLYQAWKKVDPAKPIMVAQSRLFRNVDPTYVFEYCDIADSHQGFPRDLLVNWFCASNARIKGKRTARWENGWNIQEEMLRWGDERAQYASLTKYMYRMAMLDEDYQNWCFPYTGQSWRWMQAGWMQSATDFMTMRYAATGIPVGIRRLRQMEKTLLDSTLAPADTLLIFPRTSWLAMGFGPVRDSLIAVVQNLYRNGRAFELRSEADIASGAEKLDAYKVIVLPVGAFLDDGVDEKLIAWANQGGLLVLLGPAGVYNKHGFVNGRLTKELVKELPEVTETPEREEWIWKWAGEAGTNDIIRKKTGKGEVLMTTVTLDSLLEKEKPFEEILQAMEQAAPAVSKCKNRNLGLWDLIDKQGCRYLGIINHNVDLDIESEIAIRGEFKQVTDLDIPGEFSVPVKYRDNQTCFTVKLQPGGLTVLRLEK